MILDFLNLLRRCPSCQSSFGVTPWLCRGCLLVLSRKVRLRHRWIHKNLDHYYLFDWEKGDQLSPIVHSLKGGRQLAPFDWLSCFFPAWAQGEGPLFYPTRGERDHAQVLAEALGKKWSRDAKPLLRVGSQKQSLLSKKQRTQVRFQSVLHASRRLDLVDDIVTTGATAQACHQALGQSNKMTIWSLFYRKSL